MEMLCRMCAGIADPAVCLLDPTQQRLADCVENNLNITIAADNGYPTRICTSCADGLRRWMMFRDRNQKAHGKFLKTLKSPSDVTVAPTLPQSGGEASPDTCSVTVKTGSAEQTSQVTENIKQVIRPARTFLDKWLRPSQTLKLPVVPNTSTKSAGRTNSFQESLAIKFSLKNLRVCVTRLSGEVLASLQQGRTWSGQNKVGSSLPQATETVSSTKPVSMKSFRSDETAAANQRTSNYSRELSDSANQAACGEEQLTTEGTSLFSQLDGDCVDVLSVASYPDNENSHEQDQKLEGKFGLRKSSQASRHDKIQDFKPSGRKLQVVKTKKHPANLIVKRKNTRKIKKIPHKNPKTYKCNICGSEFKIKIRLLIHIKHVHENPRNHQCNSCQKRFNTLSYLNEHIARVHSKDPPSFKCEVCGEMKKTKHHLSQHVRSSHSILKKYKCNVCHKSYSRPGYLKEHNARLHNNDLRPFKCSKCGVMKKTENALKVN